MIYSLSSSSRPISWRYSLLSSILHSKKKKKKREFAHRFSPPLPSSFLCHSYQFSLIIFSFWIHPSSSPSVFTTFFFSHLSSSFEVKGTDWVDIFTISLLFFSTNDKRSDRGRCGPKFNRDKKSQHAIAPRSWGQFQTWRAENSFGARRWCGKGKQAWRNSIASGSKVYFFLFSFFFCFFIYFFVFFVFFFVFFPFFKKTSHFYFWPHKDF